MRIQITLFLLILSGIVVAQDLVILHTNDLHSHINGFAPETDYSPLTLNDDDTKGGFARIAGLIDEQKQVYGSKLLVVDAGDFLMGTLFQTLETKTGFQLHLMKKMGYDIVALGNHEFDFGPNTLAQIIENNINLGEIPQVVNSNYIPEKDGSDSKFSRLFDNGRILRYSVIEKNGFRIGVFALLGKAANEAIPGYLNVRFDENKRVAKRIAAHLKNVEKVDLVIALSHSGVTDKGKKGWRGEDYDLAKAVDDIDIVISGHTHTELPSIVYAGKGIVVQTGSMGINVGKLEISFDSNKRPNVKYQLIAVDDKILGDSDLQRVIDKKSEEIQQLLSSEVNIDLTKPILETTFPLTLDDRIPGQSNLGPFVSDAVYYTLRDIFKNPVDMTVVATGVIRQNIEVGKTGMQNVNDLFHLMPLGIGENTLPGSPLGKIYVTGNELKKIMELILTVYHSKRDYYLFSTGMNIKYDPNKGLFRKISEMTIGTEETGYRNISFSAKDKTLYSIAANKYILSFIGAIKKMSFGLVNVTSKDSTGNVIDGDRLLIDADSQKPGIQEVKEWLSLIEYVRSFPDRNGNGIPDMPEKYKGKVNPFVVVD